MIVTGTVAGLASAVAAGAAADRLAPGPTVVAQQQQQQQRQPGGAGMGQGQRMDPGGGMGAGQGMGPGAQGGGQQRRMIHMMDQDGDGALSREEFVETPRPGGMANSDLAQRNREARFDQLDANGDGRLSPDELANMSGGVTP
jgi:hypothetical protein